MTIDVASWLRQLGLEQYEPAFRNNDVDGNVLPDLTGEDLIAIGVTSVGHRRRLLSAIAALGSSAQIFQLSAPYRLKVHHIHAAFSDRRWSAPANRLALMRLTFAPRCSGAG